MPTTVHNFAKAVSAYNQALKGDGEGMAARDTPSDASFAGLVKNAVQDVIDTGKNSEAISIAAVNEKADLSQVVTAVAEAEVVLNSMVKVRDKIIEAYQQIIKMPI